MQGLRLYGAEPGFRAMIENLGGFSEKSDQNLRISAVTSKV